MIDKVRDFIDNSNFTRSIIVTVSAVLPAFILSQLGHFDTGFTIALGAFLTYPADIPSNIVHRAKGLLVATVIVTACTLIVNLLSTASWLFYPGVVALVFILSMLSVYGQRATMISFGALIATALGTGHIHSDFEIISYTGLILAGGLFYTVVSLTFNYLNPHRYTELELANCLKLTAKYMKLRGDLWNNGIDRAAIIKKQLNLQVEINQAHENLREVLIRNRANTGNSNRSRRMLMMFISLMEILELALSTSFDHSRLHEKFGAHSKVLNTYQNLAYNLASSLKRIGKSIAKRKTYTSKHNLLADLEALENAIAEYERQLGPEAAAEGVWLLKNMMHYAEKQIEKIKVIERALTVNITFKELSKSRAGDLDKFIQPDYYPLKTLFENLTFSSTIFRHSLRLALTIALGLAVGSISELQNVYWILLTVIVIMRPGYGLTKQRSYHRIAGTVLGGVIAFGILSIINQHVVIGALAILCMILGFTFTAINYWIGATFVTMYVIFIYALLTPDISNVIQYRILDTVIGAVLAFVGNYFFWPSWEFLSLPIFIKKSIEANRNYLAEITSYYNHKGAVTTAYRLARKNAMVELGNLMGSYQRMVQEPKSKQKQLQQAYKLAVLNHTLLSSLASLGTYIQNHKTYKASEAFNVVVKAVTANLDHAMAILNLEIQAEEALHSNNEELATRFTELKNIRARELREIHLDNEEEFRLRMEEAHLVIEQLIWLNSLSENIVKAVKALDLRH
jgi:uncharacterized membrane protein (TIGR01666 family)